MEPAAAQRDAIQINAGPRKPRILLAASGSVAAIKFGNLCHCFSEWAEVKAVATKASLHFIDRASLPKDVILYTDEDEWSSWNKIGDNVLHIELRRWADIMVIAPLSANTLGKVISLPQDQFLFWIHINEKTSHPPTKKKKPWNLFVLSLKKFPCLCFSNLHYTNVDCWRIV